MAHPPPSPPPWPTAGGRAAGVGWGRAWTTSLARVSLGPRAGLGEVANCPSEAGGVGDRGTGPARVLPSVPGRALGRPLPAARQSSTRPSSLHSLFLGQAPPWRQVPGWQGVGDGDTGN